MQSWLAAQVWSSSLQRPSAAQFTQSWHVGRNSQSPAPMHWLFTHATLDGHGLLQLPQYASSVVRSTQMLPHLVVGATQFTPHAPFEQTSPAGHALPHMPQFVGSVFASTHRPPHFVCPAGQLA